MEEELIMQLTKHHGLENDFLVALLDEEPHNLSELAARICNRRTGIGADGLLLGLPGRNGVDLTMLLRNADGSVAEMSGNGIRCLAQAYAMANKMSNASLLIETAGGKRRVVIECDGPLAQVTVEMGRVKSGPAIPDAIQIDAGSEMIATVDLGNPHLVILCDDLAEVDVSDLGPRYESLFLEGINVEWVRVASAETSTLEMLVWERGVGVTQACGTGATAAAVLSNRWGLVGDDVEVDMAGGKVRVVVGEEPILIGPASYTADIEFLL